MQPAPAYPPTLYEALEALPEGLTGEILNGQLHTEPGPPVIHALANSRLGAMLSSSYEGRGDPGDWWILYKPEIHFVRDIEVVVPDQAGWRQERVSYFPEDQRFEVIPDWICEILSPATESKDRKIKFPLYARYGVQYVWMIDPIERALEVYRLDTGVWIEVGRFADADRVAAPPFEAISIDLEDLWAPTRPASV